MKSLFSRRKIAPLIVICLIIPFSSCTFRDLKKEITEAEQNYSLVGKITAPSSVYGSVIVILYAQKEGKNEIVEYTVPSDLGHFAFYKSQGTYFLAAFEDQNQNLTYDKGELAGYFGAPDKIMIPPKGQASSDTSELKHLDIRLNQTTQFLPELPSTIDTTKVSKSVFAKHGQITTLDDEIFTMENGSTGYWKPLTFLRNFGIGVYFLEPFNPDKIPVLFVHGALGTPAVWAKLVKQIDREKFQPWFYYYPSGIPLAAAGGALNDIIKKIHSAYRFKNLYVTAYSMGGLVSRSFIMKNVYSDHQDYIKLFVAISTPWNGHQLTEKGVQTAPTAIPSWYDMIPESEFIQSIYENKLPSDLKFHLLFSYRGDCSLLLANNDGTVELSSELDYRAQAEAETTFGFNEDHRSIATSPKLIEYYHRILNQSKSGVE